MAWQFFDWLLSPGFWVAASMTFTILHLVEELCGRGGPLWDNFGMIVGVRLPDWLGFALFSVALAVGLGVLAMVGYGGGNAACLSVLLGARLGDVLVSHWGLWLVGLSRPNPGIWTTPLYALEGAALLACWPLLAAGPPSPAGVLAGAGFFAAVLPTLWLAGRLVPAWRRPGA